MAYRAMGGQLVEAEDPVDGVGGDGDFYKALSFLGYVPEVSSSNRPEEPGVTVFSTEKPGEPRYYVEISGARAQVAVLLADDFVELVEVLRLAQPLISVMAMDQVSTARAVFEDAIDGLKETMASGLG